MLDLIRLIWTYLVDVAVMLLILFLAFMACFRRCGAGPFSELVCENLEELDKMLSNELDTFRLAIGRNDTAAMYESSRKLGILNITELKFRAVILAFNDLEIEFE